jgi:hypothetical protein
MNLARLIKACAETKTRAINSGDIPRSWLATDALCKKLNTDILLNIPILNSRVQGMLDWGGTKTEIVLLCDTEKK